MKVSINPVSCVTEWEFYEQRYLEVTFGGKTKWFRRELKQLVVSSVDQYVEVVSLQEIYELNELSKQHNNNSTSKQQNKE